MVINLGDGVIAAMPNDAVNCSYNTNNVFTSAASPRQCYGNSVAVTSLRRQADHIDYVLKRPASPPLAYQSPVAVLSLRRQAEKFYAFQIASGRSWGPHIFSRHK
jgi:hypothetical protein